MKCGKCGAASPVNMQRNNISLVRYPICFQQWSPPRIIALSSFRWYFPFPFLSSLTISMQFAKNMKNGLRNEYDIPVMNMTINLFFNYIKYRKKEKKEKRSKINLYVRIVLSATDIQLEYNIFVEYNIYIRLILQVTED